MTKRRGRYRGRRPDPNSKMQQLVRERAANAKLLADLVAALPFASLPDLFVRADIEAKIPEAMTDAQRRLITHRYLRAGEFVNFGAYQKKEGGSPSIWGRDVASVRAMTAKQRHIALFGESPKRPPPQRCPTTRADWRGEYRLLHAFMAARGFKGRPSQIWQGWTGPEPRPLPVPRKKRPAPDMVNDSTGSQPSPAIAQNDPAGPIQPTAGNNESTSLPVVNVASTQSEHKVA